MNDHFNTLLARKPDQAAVCDTHGPYSARHIIGVRFSQCPACIQEASDKEQAGRAHADRQAKIDARMARSGIGERFKDRNFGNYLAATDGQKHALEVARTYADDFDEHWKAGTGLTFSGKPGTGKSHLAMAVISQIIHSLKSYGQYTTCMELIREVRNTWRKDSEDSEMSVIARFSEVPLLVIDEIGVQYGTDGEQTVLFEILDRRYREMMPTILLTNQGAEGLRTFIGDRSFDRLRENSRWVAFEWESFRKQARGQA
jgi:DNA replication protein DnaC